MENRVSSLTGLIPVEIINLHLQLLEIKVMLIGEFNSLNPSHIRKVSTKVDHYEVPYFLVTYSNGDKEYFSVKEAFVKDIKGYVDSKLCIAINNHYFN